MRRFKERAPTRTVAIIRRFFAGVSEHFSLLETPVLDGGVGVYSLSLQLRYDDTELLRTHVKGMQPVYARASAYAELYERFCNRHGMTGCLLDDPSEETTPSLQHIAAAFPAFCGRETAFLRYLQSECPAVREKVFLPVAPADAPLRIDPRHIFSYCGTNGMAAGNTLSEALVQGMSELAERNVLCRCLRDDPLKLQEIPDAVLAAKAPESFEKIRKVRAKGFSLRFFDAAGATGLPVGCTRSNSAPSRYFPWRWSAASQRRCRAARCRITGSICRTRPMRAPGGWRFTACSNTETDFCPNDCLRMRCRWKHFPTGSIWMDEAATGRWRRILPRSDRRPGFICITAMCR